MPKLAFLSSSVPEALQAKKCFEDLYSSVAPVDADILVVLGGDGLMLETMHQYRETGVPIYGIHYGSVGFLMNACVPEDLLFHLKHAKSTSLYPLEMTAQTASGQAVKKLAFNEVSLFRETYQIAKIQIQVDDVVRLPELFCDGVLIATPAGSTAYNLSAHGPILPLESSLLALTPLNAFRPRRWQGALLPETVTVTFTVLESEKRPVSAVADFQEVRNITSVSVRQVKNKPVTLLFDEGHNLHERILREQFLV